MSKEEAKAKEDKRGVGTAATEALCAGKSNEEALKAVQAEFPEGKTTLASIGWYRNKLRSEGKKVLSARELKKKVAAATAATKKKADPLD